MHFLGHYFGLSKQTEVLVLTLIGICSTVFDESLIYLNSNLHKIWAVTFDSGNFSKISENYIKYILSGIVLVRSVTVHLYLAFYIVMLWPAIFEERPVLLLPWLLVGIVKSLMMSVASLSIGMYTCAVSHFYPSACLDFFLAQVVDNAPSFYMWFCVLSYYNELKSITSVLLSPSSRISYDSNEVALRRRKVRSMTENSDLKRRISITEERNLISVSTIENLVDQLTMHLPRNSRSLDTLLASMAAEAAILCVYEDVRSDNMISVSLQERAKKLLRLTEADIKNAKLGKDSNEIDIFSESMLLICDLANGSYRAATKQEYLTSDSHSENRPSGPNSTKAFVTDILSDVSEFEIRPILNYSTTSMTTIREALTLSDNIMQRKILDLSKSLVPVPITVPIPEPTIRIADAISYVDEENQIGSYLNSVCSETQFPSETEFKEVNKKHDMACQVNTLSRNILQMSDLDVLKSFQSSLTMDTRVCCPSKCSVGIQPYCRYDTKKLPMVSPFRTDGYTIAYMTKMRQKNNCQSH